jgi:hypothetical protein
VRSWGAAPSPAKNLFGKRFLDFQKLYDNNFYLSFLGFLRPFFKKGLKWGMGQSPI